MCDKKQNVQRLPTRSADILEVNCPFKKTQDIQIN